MVRFCNHRNIFNQCVVFMLTALIALGGFLSGIARALPPPKPVEELFHDSDLVIKGQVVRVSLYSQWLSQVRSGELGEDAAALAKNLPDSDAGLLRLLHNFPYNASQVAIDGVYIAELKVEEVLKGKSQGMIFIPFVSYHFLANRSIEGPWSERTYKPGERLNLYLKKNGPFYESAWWNAVHPVK